MCFLKQNGLMSSNHCSHFALLSCQFNTPHQYVGKIPYLSSHLKFFKFLGNEWWYILELPSQSWPKSHLLLCSMQTWAGTPHAEGWGEVCFCSTHSYSWLSSPLDGSGRRHQGGHVSLHLSGHFWRLLLGWGVLAVLLADGLMISWGVCPNTGSLTGICLSS